MQTEPIKTGEWVEREERVIASKLFSIRSKIGIERDKLAGMVGIADNELKDYEFGLQPIPASTLLMLAFAMGVSMDYFFNDEIRICGTNVEMMQMKKVPALLS